MNVNKYLASGALLLLLLSTPAEAGKLGNYYNCVRAFVKSWLVRRGPNPDMHPLADVISGLTSKTDPAEASAFMFAHRELEPVFPVLFSKRTVYQSVDPKKSTKKLPLDPRVAQEMKDLGLSEEQFTLILDVPGTTDIFFINFGDAVYDGKNSNNFLLGLELNVNADVSQGSFHTTAVFRSRHDDGVNRMENGASDRYFLTAVQTDPRFSTVIRDFGGILNPNPSSPEVRFELKGSDQLRKLLERFSNGFSLVD